MSSCNSSFIKLSEKGTIDECQKLLKTLSSMVESCPICTNKLKEKKMAQGYQPCTPTGQDDNTQSTSLQAGGKKYYQ